MIQGAAPPARLRSKHGSDHLMRSLLPLAFALLYATVLTSLPLDAFLDRANYLIYAADSDQILARYGAVHQVAVAANEPLWLLINIGLSRLFAPETVLRVLIFVPAFLVPWLLVRHNPRHALWLMLLMLMPQVLKNHVIHLRQGVGLAVFLLGFFSGSKWLGGGLMLAAGFIHSSFLFIVLIRGIVAAVGLFYLSPRLRIALYFLCFGLVGVSTGIIASALGARQGAQYAEVLTIFSGLGFLFWTVVLLLFLSAGRLVLEQNMTALAILSFYLATYFFLPVSARIFESGLLLVLLGGLSLPGWRREIFLLHILTYAVTQYAMSLDTDWLGWGINS